MVPIKLKHIAVCMGKAYPRSRAMLGLSVGKMIL